MKQIALILACICMLGTLWGCGSEEQPAPQAAPEGKTVTFQNGVTEGDLWILPHTQENRKASLWGAASLAGVKTGESRLLPLPEPGEEGLYLFRMIDAEGFYYAADGLTLEEGWTLEIREEDGSFTLEIRDGAGEIKDAREVFAARL